MTSPPPIHHGGGLDAAASRFGIPREDWIDLSTGINPLPYPVPPIAPQDWHRLPDREGDAALRAAAAACYGAPDASLVVPAPGSQALIQWIPRLWPAGEAAIVGPTYAEHAACWRAAGHRPVIVSSLDEIPAACPAVVVVNPNNPTGERHAADRLLGLCRPGRLVVVDEAFADVAPEISLAPRAGTPGLVVLRSFGKFFGLAGLRLGFALAGRDLAARIGEAVGPWAVSGPALAIAAGALADTPWIADTRRRLASDARRLRDLLADHGLPPVGGTDLFVLVRATDAAGTCERLGRAGILVRHFPDNPWWLRFGLPGHEPQWERLRRALSH